MVFRVEFSVGRVKRDTQNFLGAIFLEDLGVTLILGLPSFLYLFCLWFKLP